MLAKRELRRYAGNVRVWVGKYKNLTNLPHWHYDCELIYIDMGGATVFVDGAAYHAKEKQSIFIGTRQPHYIQAETGSILSFFLFDYKLVKSVIGDRMLKTPLLKNVYGLPELQAKIDAELAAKAELSALSVGNRIERLMLDVFMSEETCDAGAEENYHTQGYKKLLKNIDENYENYTLADAARFLCFSESYFSKFFKEMAGITFSKYLNLVRVEKAIETIRKKNVTVTKAAIDCGFGTIRNFNRVFKSVTGFSPKHLPKSYDTLGIHPTYGVEETFDPTDENSELI